MTSTWLQLTKYALIALIWAGVLVFGISIAGNFALAPGEGSGLVGMGIAAFICAAVSTGLILDEKKSEKHDDEAEASKRKNDQRVIDPLSLLTPEDVAELRDDIKRDLRRRLLEGGDGELGSLDALLAESDFRRR